MVPKNSTELPTEIKSFDTLIYLGLNNERAAELWAKWAENGYRYFDDDQAGPDMTCNCFGCFVRDCLRHWRYFRRADFGDSDVDWRPALRASGANEALIEAIMGTSETDGIRLTQSTAEWIDNAIMWRWEWLCVVYEAHNGGFDLSNGIHVHAAKSTVPEHDVTNITWNRETNRPVKSDRGKIDHIPLWKAVPRVHAEAVWDAERAKGAFSIDRLHSCPSASLCPNTTAQHWTPDLEFAQMYADYCQKIAGPAPFCLARLEVPNSVFKKHTRKLLQYPSEKWKRVTYASHNRRCAKPGSLTQELLRTALLVGDIATGLNSRSTPLKSWEEVSDKHTLKLKSGQRATQFVFDYEFIGRHEDYEEFIDAVNKLESRFTIRDIERPNVILPPIGGFDDESNESLRNVVYVSMLSDVDW
ncbi:unnamed protein product [Zymoseptoria tritici ST99CH_3D7]|uniref:Uncharacterized protein n=1 Tax=Zymoseptoria tritici (strain ST99CH_3D7) TaxID=1276538 RepID=A0A1X7RGM0_ZYMT9|nr:unnamed protein product [Zymoseptoria tritici ST99CH_3D7]